MRTSSPRASVVPALALAASFAAGCTVPGETRDVEPEQSVSLEEVLAEGDEALRKGDLDTAQMKLAIAAERDPGNVDTLYKLGVIHNERGTLDVATGVLRAALEIDRTHQGAKETLGLVLLKREQLDEARTVLEEALETRPRAWQALNALGVIADMRAEHGAARALFERALEIEPRSAKVTNNLGYSFYLAGEDGAAERLFERAVRLSPDYVHAWSNLALVHARNGRDREAAAAFEKIVEAHRAANNLGYLGLLNDDPGLAREQLERAVALSPSYYDTANRNLEALDARGRTATARRGPAAPVRGNDAGDRAVAGRDEPAEGGAEMPVIRVGTASSPDLGSADPVASRRDRAETSRAELRRRQRFLDFLGYRIDKIDGIAGENTAAAVSRFQGAHGLERTGRLDRRTATRLRRQTVETMQLRLRGLGYDPGKADGVVGGRTREALRAFRRAEGLPPGDDFDGTELAPLRDATARASERLNSVDSLDLSSRG